MYTINPQVLYTKRIIPPFPLDWILKLDDVDSAGSFKVALILWYNHCITRSKTFDVTINDFTSFYPSINASVLHHALRKLEKCGLIKLETHIGRSPTITLIMGDWDIHTYKKENILYNMSYE